MAGRGSAEALQHYRSQRTPPISGEASRPRRWTPPPYAYDSPRRFGALDAMALWFMLDTLSRPSSGTFFRQHQDDPGYRQWRAEADRQAKDDPELRSKLNALDHRLSQPAAPPFAFPWVTAGVLLGVLAVLWRTRRGLLGGGAGRLADGILKARSGMAASRPSPYRIGQTIPLDPAPFVLAGQAIKVMPPPDDGSGMVSVAVVGVVSGDGDWHRLWLPDGERMIQLAQDECRLYQRIDRVFPATPEDWGFWLDETEGLIGWPRFETKDGKSYDRLWGGGEARLRPRNLTETATDLTGPRVSREMAMLYGAPTGLPPPAPQMEYLWLAAVERDGQAWIEMRAGIDINPASLI